ncbi:MAG: Rieske (2Fe-2S) protein [Pirellulales bacterium]|nr:Rieske (2Fe-2S) protein [Pirellulales bacterium]
MSQWLRVASLSDLPEQTGFECVAGDRLVALFRIGTEVYALDGVCPHQGGPLGRGELEGCVVTCPWHGWQFDVRSGQHQISPTIRQPALEVRVEGDDVFVRLGPD